MSSLKLYKKLKQIYNNKLSNIPLVTSSTLNIIDNNIEIDLNGMPSSILIDYTGSGIFQSEMPINIKVKISKNKILIVNTFKKNIPSFILSFSGNINITHCQIMNFDSSKIASTINNNQKEQLLDKAKTNMEDDTLVLYEESKPIETSAYKSGLIKPTINPNTINKFGKIQKYGKIEKQSIVNTIVDFSQKNKIISKYNPLKEAKQIEQVVKVKPLKQKMTRIQKQRVAKPTTQTNTLKYEGGK